MKIGTFLAQSVLGLPGESRGTAGHSLRYSIHTDVFSRREWQEEVHLVSSTRGLQFVRSQERRQIQSKDRCIFMVCHQ